MLAASASQAAEANTLETISCLHAHTLQRKTQGKPGERLVTAAPELLAIPPIRVAEVRTASASFKKRPSPTTLTRATFVSLRTRRSKACARFCTQQKHWATCRWGHRDSKPTGGSLAQRPTQGAPPHMGHNQQATCARLAHEGARRWTRFGGRLSGLRGLLAPPDAASQSSEICASANWPLTRNCGSRQARSGSLRACCDSPSNRIVGRG